MKKNPVARAIYQAKKEKTIIRANIRLKKNGQFSSIEGKVDDIKVSMDGNPYIVIDPKGNKHIQSVALSNVIAVYKDNKLFKR